MPAPRARDGSASLNLLPVMNLVTILIPLLLLSAQFVNLAVIDSTVPAISDTRTPPPDTPPTLQLTVAITARGFAVRTSTGALGADGEPTEQPTSLPCATEACGGAESYDFEGLTRLLAAVKDAHPSEEDLIVLPDARVPVEVIVGTMDAARQDAGEGGRLLFPNVVIGGGVG